jgi:hypothetical protein
MTCLEYLFSHGSLFDLLRVEYLLGYGKSGVGMLNDLKVWQKCYGSNSGIVIVVTFAMGWTCKELWFDWKEFFPS